MMTAPSRPAVPLRFEPLPASDNGTRVFGQVIRSDSDPHDYVVYKGETFRIAGSLYRVNWISQAEAALAAGVYRSPDAVSAPLKFEID